MNPAGWRTLAAAAVWGVVVAALPRPVHACAGCRNPSLLVSRGSEGHLSEGALRLGASLASTAVNVIVKPLERSSDLRMNRASPPAAQSDRPHAPIIVLPLFPALSNQMMHAFQDNPHAVRTKSKTRATRWAPWAGIAEY